MAQIYIYIYIYMYQKLFFLQYGPYFFTNRGFFLFHCVPGLCCLGCLSRHFARRCVSRGKSAATPDIFDDVQRLVQSYTDKKQTTVEPNHFKPRRCCRYQSIRPAYLTKTIPIVQCPLPKYLVNFGPALHTTEN